MTIKRTDRTLTLSPTWRQTLPNGMTKDVAQVIRAHGYKMDGAALLAALRDLTRDRGETAS